MATMVKEKRREKKKSKERTRLRESLPDEQISEVTQALEQVANFSVVTEHQLENIECANVNSGEQSCEDTNITYIQDFTQEQVEFHIENNPCVSTSECESTSESCLNVLPDTVQPLEVPLTENVAVNPQENITDTYKYLNERLQRIVIPKQTEVISEVRESDMLDPHSYLKVSGQAAIEPRSCVVQTESIIPSAPVFEEQPQIRFQDNIVQEPIAKVQCMTKEEAVNLFGGKVMGAVKAMSEREEAIVEGGPVSGAEHPLVDLLSTFKSSLRSLESERSRLTCNYADEEKSRSRLWKIEKLNIDKKKLCKCGTNVELRANYEHAELLTDRLPVARLKLEGLLRDVQESYCHYQHQTILTYYQIEEFLIETMGTNTVAIREALFLILQALRMSDDSVPALPAALQRWAAALVAALVGRDVAQLLFVIHHLFRQSRSVRWAARVLEPRVPDAATAAQTLAVLDILLSSPRLDSALECTEEAAEEGWEEVSGRGAGGAVSGALREMDLLAILRAFPLHQLLARILIFTQQDIRDARPYEWGDARGGSDVIFACAGVRTLLAVAERASNAHEQYVRLNKKLRAIAVAALKSLSCLYQSPRAPYYPEMEAKILSELEACFTAAFNMFGTADLHKLDTTLLTDNTAKDYCLAYMIGLHDTKPREIDSLLIYTPVLSCGQRIRVLSEAVNHRDKDHELSRIVMDFLLQTGGKADSPSTSCKGGCAAAAREHLSRLLDAHAYLRTLALYSIADLAQVSTIDQSIMESLGIQRWRPHSDEISTVLDYWAQRCPQLLSRLLLKLDCTPHTGLSLPAQLSVGTFLCEFQRNKPAEVELCWRALLRLRTHRVCWSLDTDVPNPDQEPTDLFSSAYALLSCSWGHSIPLICSRGVHALCALCARPRAAVHCLAPVMLVMAHSPESVSLTPQFTELLTSLMNCAPTLVQRAFGRGGVSGAELLLRLILCQLQDERKVHGGGSVLRAWLHALWRLPLRSAATVLDIAALAARDWPALDSHAAFLIQENGKEFIANAVRNAAVAPLLAECALRACHTHTEVNTGVFGALSNVLWEQRVNGHKVHVDNALQKIKAKVTSEELVIYRCATAVLAAPLSHPAHLTLWRLFFHLYLQRPPSNMRDTALPVGPLFFSGLIKSRTITHLIKKLQETAAYHRTEAESYKNNEQAPSRPTRVVKSESITIEKGLLPALSITDLTGESSQTDESDVSESEEDDDIETPVGAKETETESEEGKKHASNMASYHTAAERMVKEMCGWLEEGDRVRASPHHADIARFIPEQALEEAWQDCLSRSQPQASEELDEFPRRVIPPDISPEPNKTPLDVAVRSIMKIKCRSGVRSRRLLKLPFEEVDVRNSRALFSAVDKHLKNIEEFAKTWISEVNRISGLDTKLWELTASLRVPRPLPPVTVPCPNRQHANCKPTIFYIEEREWCISVGAERAIKENRSSWISAVRSLARARPDVPRTAAALHSIARRVRDKASAVSVAERVWRAAGASSARCPLTGATLEATVYKLAETWIRHDAELVVEMVSRWCGGCESQRALCGSLLTPRCLPLDTWPRVYAAILHATLPSHAKFSYLSKFEMSHWSRTAGQSARREMISSLLEAQVKHGSAPAQEHCILLELLGVHTAAVVSADELCKVVLKFARMAADDKLPPRQWTHLLKAVRTHCGSVSFDQLGHLLRDLGALWWQARSLYNGLRTLVPHSLYVADVQSYLLNALRAAAQELSYQPERVGTCTWSALQESWSAWVAPHPATPPLLPSLAHEAPERDGEYTLMLQRFRSCVERIMSDCPGCETVILQSLFEWCVACHVACLSGKQEGRLQSSELLVTLASLPWTAHQWFYGNCVNVATQICATNDREIMTWCCERWSETDAVTLLRGVTDVDLVPRLVALLYVFTGGPLNHQGHILSEACRLPWHKLPMEMLTDALDRFFATHHDPTLAYHDRPEFQVLLHACSLRVDPMSRDTITMSRDRRALAVSTWVRAAASPALLSHVDGHARALLSAVTDLAPYLDESSGELEELLGRASVIMCMEPAAAAALPVWQSWVSRASLRLSLACVSAACALTAPAYCALLADSAVKAYFTHTESKWCDVAARWCQSPWRDAHELTSRACPLAGYACALTQPLHRATGALRALMATTLDFVANEVIIAVWICYACRVAVLCDAGTVEAVSASDVEDSGEVARALLRAWAAPPRRSLLRMVTLQADSTRPTALHRVLCRYAECIITPCAAAVEAYEAACAAAGCSDVIPWAAAATAARLPRLAVRLYPAHDRYFTEELNAASQT